MKKTVCFCIVLMSFLPLKSYAQNNLAEQPAKKTVDNFIAKELEEINSGFKKKYNFKSLMFSDEEFDAIRKAILSYRSGAAYSPEQLEQNVLSDAEKARLEKERIAKEVSEINERSKIYLGSLLYISKEHWAIWLNNDKLSSNINKKENEFYVKEIDGHKVKILWTLSLSKWKILSGKSSVNDLPKTNDKNQVLIEFVLQPNQTFILKYNNVIEGRNVSLSNSNQEEKKDSKK